MGASLFYLIGQKDQLLAWVPFGTFVEVLVFIAIGAAVYGVAALLFGAVRISDLKGITRRSAN